MTNLRNKAEEIRKVIQPQEKEGPEALGELIGASPEILVTDEGRKVWGGRKTGGAQALGADAVRWAVLSATGVGMALEQGNLDPRIGNGQDEDEEVDEDEDTDTNDSAEVGLQAQEDRDEDGGEEAGERELNTSAPKPTKSHQADNPNPNLNSDPDLDLDLDSPNANDDIDTNHQNSYEQKEPPNATTNVRFTLTSKRSPAADAYLNEWVEKKKKQAEDDKAIKSAMVKWKNQVNKSSSSR